MIKKRKKRKWWVTQGGASSSAEQGLLIDSLAELPTGLENVTVFDRAIWLDELQPSSRQWIIAFEKIDRDGDKEPLLKLLKFEAPPPDVRQHLVHLLRRYDFRPKRGRKATPSYDRSPAEALLEFAKDDVRHYQKSGMSVADAVMMAAKEHDIPEDTLENAYRGKRTSSRRMKNQRRP